MPRLLKGAAKKVKAGMGEWLDKPDETPAMLAKLADAQNESTEKQLKVLTEVAKYASIQSEMMMKMLEQSDRWRFTIHERDEEGRIVSMTAEKE